MPGVGDQLGRYTLLKRLAVGGMGEVFIAARVGPIGLGSLVALKVLRDELAVDQKFVDMLVDEANITKHLSHRNLVSVLDLCEDNGSYYIAMEFVRGVTAERLIETLVERGRKLDVPLAVHVGIELCNGLQYAHTRVSADGDPLGIIHRDVTPANILLSTEGEVKLTDFGIARAKGRIHKTEARVLKGKFGYMAPEMVRYESIDARADLFCVGVVLYLLAAGRHPVAQASVMEAIQRYEAKQIPPPSTINPEVPSDLDDVLMKALDPLPSMRWQSAEELGKALQDVLHAHASWRGSEEAMAAGLVHRIQQIAPEVFTEIVSKETIERIADEHRFPDGWLPYNADLGSTSGLATGPLPLWMKEENEPVRPPSNDLSSLGDDIPPVAKPPMAVVAVSQGGEHLHSEHPTLGVGHETQQLREGDAPTYISNRQENTDAEDPAATLLEGLRSQDVHQAIANFDAFGTSQTILQGLETPAHRSGSQTRRSSPALGIGPIPAGSDDATYLREPKDGFDIGNDPTFLRSEHHPKPPRSGGAASLVEGLTDEPLVGNDRTASDSPFVGGREELSPARNREVNAPSASRRSQGGHGGVSSSDRNSVGPVPKKSSELMVTLAVFVAVVAVFGVGCYVWFATELLWPDLRITTQPSGVRVFIDGDEQSDRTPLVAKISPGHRHRIELRADGYQPALRQITDVVQRARTYMLEVRMKRVAPVLSIRPVSARVFVNGKPVGSGPEVTLEDLPGEGPVHIRVVAHRYVTHKLRFKSGEAVPARVDVVLRRVK